MQGQYIQKLSQKVLRIKGLNPSPYTLDGSNIYLIDYQSKHPILIDTGQNNIPNYKQLLQEVRDQFQINQIFAVLITHYHRDHMGGLQDVQNVFKIEKIMKYEPTDKRMIHIGDKAVIQTNDSKITALFTPGHSDDHLCFYLYEEQALFSGDNILGEGTTLVTNLKLYMQSLNYMRDQFPLKLIYPGHGNVITNPIAKINEYIDHRMLREKQVLQAIKEDRSTNLDLIVDKIYVGLSQQLKPAAKNNVLLHIKKLYEDKEIDEAQFKYITEIGLTVSKL